MLFNSYAFILGFLPICLAGYFLFGRRGKVAGAAWLAVCSIFFYGWWDYRYLPLAMALSSSAASLSASTGITVFGRTSQLAWKTPDETYFGVLAETQPLAV